MISTSTLVDPFKFWYLIPGMIPSYDAGTQAASEVTDVILTSYGGGMVDRLRLVLLPAWDTPAIDTFTLDTSVVTGGAPASGSVTLSAPAPVGGLTVTLSGSRVGLASVPASVTIPEGAMTATFTIGTASTLVSRGVMVRAVYEGQDRTAILTVESAPAGLSAGSPSDLRHESVVRDEPPRLDRGTAVRATSVDPVQVAHYKLYTPELNLLAETVASTTSVKAIAHEYIWFAGQPVAQVAVATGAIDWTFTDHLGTPILQTDANATVTWRIEYEPYGDVFEKRAGEGKHQPLRFPGQEFDANAPDRAYNVFRWYRAGWGRYTQADPIGIYGDINLFKYAINNPTSFYDPSGLASIEYNVRRTDVDLADLDSRCRDTRGGVSGGGCTANAYAVAYCRCRCEPNLGFTPETRIVVNANIIIFNGSWPQLRRTRTPHPSVRDSGSAEMHELQWHIYAAGDRVHDIISALETAQPSMESCQRQCDTIAQTANREFLRLLRQTQAYEESGRDPRRGLR